MIDDRKDLPAVSSDNFLQRVRETLQTYMGSQGNVLDRGVTLRDLSDTGLIDLSKSYLTTRRGSPVAGPGPAAGGAESVPDLTPPPTPTGFTVGAGISHLFIGSDPQTYSQGRGHLVTRLYGATWTTGDLPVFADATVLTEFQGTVFAHPTNPATTWHLWITWVTRDGVESPTPAGGTNGLVVTSGQDVSSLLDALAGQITQGQLYGDLGARIDLIDGSGAGSVNARLSTEASTRATQTGELYAKYTVKVDVAGLISGYGLASTANNAAPTSSFGVRANAFFVSPPAVASATEPSANLYDGYVWLDTSVVPNVTRYRSGSSWVLNAPVLPFVVQATPTSVNGVAVPAGVYANDLFVKNGTITNAKIANLSVDDAKIANLSVSKLDAGSLKVGSYISSSNYVSGSQGFAVWATGAAEFNNVTVRGAVYANTGVFSGTVYAISGSFSGAVYASSGSFTGNIYSNTGTIGGVKINGNGLNCGSFLGYAWPTDGGGGFHLGPNGLLIGNANLGRYLQIVDNGDIYTPGFNVINGTMTVNQANVINTLNIAGNAVTVPGANSGSGYSATVTIHLDVSAPVVLIATFYGQKISYFNPQILRNGLVVVSGVGQSSGGVDPILPVTITGVDYPGPGTHTYTVNGWYSYGTTEASTNTTLTVMGAKR